MLFILGETAQLSGCLCQDRRECDTVYTGYLVTAGTVTMLCNVRTCYTCHCLYTTEQLQLQHVSTMLVDTSFIKIMLTLYYFINMTDINIKATTFMNLL